MPDLALTTSSARIAGRRIPVPAVKRKRTPATTKAASAAKTAGHAATTAGHAAKTAGTSAARAAGTAPHAAANTVHTGRAAVHFAQNIAPRPPASRSKTIHRAPAVTAAIAAGAGLEYLLDPAGGRRRRPCAARSDNGREAPSRAAQRAARAPRRGQQLLTTRAPHATPSRCAYVAGAGRVRAVTRR